MSWLEHLDEAVKEIAAENKDTLDKAAEVVKDAARNYSAELDTVKRAIEGLVSTTGFPPEEFRMVQSQMQKTLNIYLANNAAVNPMFFAREDKPYKILLTDSKTCRLSATSAAYWTQIVDITVSGPSNPDDEAPVMARTTFRGQGEGAIALKNERNEQVWTYRAMTATARRPWVIQLNFTHQVAANAPISDSAAVYRMNGNSQFFWSLGVEDNANGDDDRNDTILKIEFI